MLSDWIAWTLGNFSLSMFVLAIIFIIIHKLIMGKRISESEVVYRWMALFALGLTGLYAAVMHVVYPEFTAAAIGWQSSPFQFEVGMADLALGILGLLSFRGSYGFRSATVINSIFFLWGCAAGHIYQMISNHDYAIGNVGSWFWMDIIIPLILLICIANLKSERTIA